MRTSSGLRASRNAAGMTRGRFAATSPGQFSTISGFGAGAWTRSKAAASAAASPSQAASAVSTVPERPASFAISASLPREDHAPGAPPSLLRCSQNVARIRRRRHRTAGARKRGQNNQAASVDAA
jgi:hypothetical protein